MTHETRPEVERWFIGRGLPQFIDNYSARDDILTRMTPFVGVVFAAEVVLAVFGERFAGWTQAMVVVGVLAIVMLAIAATNSARGRRALQAPTRVGPIEIGAFVIVPAAVAAAFGSNRAAAVPALLVGNVALLLLAYPITSYGVLPMTSWAAGQLSSQLRGMANLMIKTLPLLLLFSMFLFLNAEVWQVANDFAWPMFIAVLLGLALIGSLFLALATQTNVVALSTFDSWSDVCAYCEGSPLEGVSPDLFSGEPASRQLPTRARFNLALVVFVNQSIQVLLIAAVTFAFYVTFGLLTVREDTIAQWVSDGALPARDRYGDLTVFGHELVLSRQLLVVSGFITGFAALQFVVQLVTDATYREQFARGMAAETRQVLAVRAAYLARPSGR